MEVKINTNPLNKIFKQNSKGIITEEIENHSNFPLLFDYLKNNKNPIKDKIEIITQLT